MPWALKWASFTHSNRNEARRADSDVRRSGSKWTLVVASDGRCACTDTCPTSLTAGASEPRHCCASSDTETTALGLWRTRHGRAARPQVQIRPQRAPGLVSMSHVYLPTRTRLHRWGIKVGIALPDAQKRRPRVGAGFYATTESPSAAGLRHVLRFTAARGSCPARPRSPRPVQRSRRGFPAACGAQPPRPRSGS